MSSAALTPTTPLQPLPDALFAVCSIAALREHLGLTVRKLGAARAIDQWYFLRYADPEPHIRLRVHGDPSRLLTEAVRAIRRSSEALIQERRISSLVFDTYEREVERYGGIRGVILAERIFAADSEAVLDLLGLYPGRSGIDERRLLAIAGIGALFAGLGLDTAGKLMLLERTPPNPQAELGWAKRFRVQTASMLAALSCSTPNLRLERGFAVLSRRASALAPTLLEVRHASDGGKLSNTLKEVALSYSHMFVNRLFPTVQRSEEDYLYYSLRRMHRSRLAQATDQLASG